MNVKDPIRKLPGIGPKREAALNERGIRTVGDLLGRWPTDYIDRSPRGGFDAPSEGKVTVRAVVTAVGKPRRLQGGRSLFSLSVTDDDGRRGQIYFFNSPWLTKAFKAGNAYYFYGEVREKNGRRSMGQPAFVKVDKADGFFDLTPVYRAVGSVSGESLGGTIKKTLTAGIDIPETLPAWFRDKYHLMDAAAAMTALHLPKTTDDVEAGRRRVKYEEALKINLGIAAGRTHGRHTHVRIGHFEEMKRFEDSLPFALTDGQIKVMGEIMADLKGEGAMNRLVQGDVGSGKTVIAAACAFLTAISGYQSAYMAPTEILAEQHAETMRRFLSPFDIRVALLTGKTRGAERDDMLAAIASGEARVIVGTHALFQKNIDYYHLGMVITDEQHRFGVGQRGMLALKGESPHTLVMSATPIPRTLALTLYGDLDLSVIDTMPEGRKPVKTYFYTEKAMPKILAFMAKEMAAGYRGLIVCPFVEASEEMEKVRDATSVSREVDAFYQGLYTVGCLHGRMKSEEKNKIIADFHKGEIDLLVATSVIEVGIDVPELSVMAVMSADRFGLSQLHQLRGRVGRGDRQAYCFLVSDQLTDPVIERMKVLVGEHDGRAIAEADYRLRGPGDYFGFRQHGFPEFDALDPYADADILAETKADAEVIFDSPKKEDMLCRAYLTEAFFDGVSRISISMN